MIWCLEFRGVLFGSRLASRQAACRRDGPVVGAPDAGTVAAASGLTRGETILKINGEPMASWQQVRWRLLQLAVEKQPARLEVIDPEQRLTWRTLDLSGFHLEGLDGDPLALLGLRLARPDVARSCVK